MESSRRDLLIDMVVKEFTFNNNQITLSPCFTFTPKIGVGLPKPKIGFRFIVQREEQPKHFT